MIDFHTHTFFSDGALSPAEHIRRAVVAGYKTIGITDHVDFSNIEFVYENVSRMAAEMRATDIDIDVIPGVEITHVPVSLMHKIFKKARNMGIPLVIVHGESPVEPVEPGTNRAAIENGVDILAHPGLITAEEMKLAKDNDVNIEITARKGHSITNGHVAKLAMEFGTKLVLDSDAHIHSDFLTETFRNVVLNGAGLSKEKIIELNQNMKNLRDNFLNRIS